jgi:hypothetical protein
LLDKGGFKKMFNSKPEADYTNNKIIDTENLEADNQSVMDEKFADMMLSMKAINKRPINDVESIFVVGKGDDGKIIPLPRRKAEDN